MLSPRQWLGLLLWDHSKSPLVLQLALMHDPRFYISGILAVVQPPSVTRCGCHRIVAYCSLAGIHITSHSVVLCQPHVQQPPTSTHTQTHTPCHKQNPDITHRNKLAQSDNLLYRIYLLSQFIYCRIRNHDWQQHSALCTGGNGGGNYDVAKITN